MRIHKSTFEEFHTLSLGFKKLKDPERMQKAVHKMCIVIANNIKIVIADLKYGRLKVHYALRHRKGVPVRVPVDGLFIKIGNLQKNWKTPKPQIVSKDKVVGWCQTNTIYAKLMMFYSRKYIPGGKSILEEAVDRSTPALNKILNEYADEVAKLL